jgi:hypothetical protein
MAQVMKVYCLRFTLPWKGRESVKKLINGKLITLPKVQQLHKCEICRRTAECVIHHVYFGGKNRKQSERYGMLSYLCVTCHDDLHAHRTAINGKDFDQLLKAHYQRKFERVWSRSEFIKAYGRNYR